MGHVLLLVIKKIKPEMILQSASLAFRQLFSVPFRWVLLFIFIWILFKALVSTFPPSRTSFKIDLAMKKADRRGSMCSFEIEHLGFGLFTATILRL